MKKTLIALMALAGVSFGAETVNDTLAKALADANYTAGKSFSITLNTSNSEGWGGLTTSDNHITLRTQASSGTQYVNCNGSSKGWPDVSDWSMSVDSIDDSTSVTATYTISSTTQPTGYWMTPIVQVNNDGQYEVCNGVRNDKMSSFTIAYDEETKTSTFTAVRTVSSNEHYHTDPTNWQAQTARTNTDYNNLNYTFATSFVVEGLVLDASKFNISNGGITSASVVAIPEPATATLSLLALAGLCARRRRG